MGLKIRVTNSDGHYRGGLFTPDDYDHARIWHGPPGVTHQDHLYNLLRSDEPTYGRSWYLYRRAVKPELTGSEECDDLFDHASHVVRLTPAEARRWLGNGPHDPPNDLIEYLDDIISETDSDPLESKDPKRPPLTDAQLEVWNMLSGRILTAKEVALKLPRKPSESAVAKLIKKMVDNGYPIRNIRGRGYYRENAPPVDLTGLPADSD